MGSMPGYRNRTIIRTREIEFSNQRCLIQGTDLIGTVIIKADSQAGKCSELGCGEATNGELVPGYLGSRREARTIRSSSYSVCVKTLFTPMSHVLEVISVACHHKADLRIWRFLPALYLAEFDGNISLVEAVHMRRL
jgi:hypothetical protein